MMLRARWLLRPGLPAVENAAVAVHEGRVAAAGRWPDVAKQSAGGPVEDLGDVVLLPGLVNAHTHLELSDLRGRFPRPRSFLAWLRSLVKARRKSERDEAAAVRAGAAESLAAGTTTLADISLRGAGSAELTRFPLWSTAFVEFYGHSESQVRERSTPALAAAEALPQGERFRVGFSPHAPYTAGPRAYAAAAREADARDWPLTTHLHETRDEIELYVSGRSRFKRSLLLRAYLLVGGFRPSGKSPIVTLAEAGFFDRPVLVAHGNYLDEADVAVLARSGSTVAFCPRSHDYFGHADHPYRRLLAAGVPVALGTDSLASSPSLSVLEEMRFLHGRDPSLPVDVLLTMATAAGADALGRRGRAGRLAVGEDADVVAVRPPAACAAGPCEALLDPQAHVAGVWILGRRADAPEGTMDA